MAGNYLSHLSFEASLGYQCSANESSDFGQDTNPLEVSVGELRPACASQTTAQHAENVVVQGTGALRRHPRSTGETPAHTGGESRGALQAPR